MSPSTFKGLYKLECLVFCFNPFQTLPVGIFSDLINLKTLTILSNHLKSIPDDAFKSLSVLEKLTINGLVFTPQALGTGFVHLTRLEYFDLTFSFTKTHVFFNNKTFYNLHKSPLKSLSLSSMPAYTNVTGQAGIFKPFRHLNMLNKLDITGQLAYTALPSLDSDLHEISILLYKVNEQITSSLLHQLTKWKSTPKFLKFRYGYNSRKVFEHTTFIKFSKLHVLSISNVGLDNVAYGAFHGLSRLLELDLSRNRLVKFYKVVNMINECTSLKILDLSYNQLVRVYTLAPLALPLTVANLNLDHNPLTLTCLTNSDFANVSHITLSHLSKGFDFDQQTYLPTLMKLDMSQPLSKDILSQSYFIFSRSFPNLKVLILSEIYIFKIATVQNLSLLEQLDTQESFINIKDLPLQWGLHFQFSNLKKMNLASNRLTTISEMEFHRTIPEVQYLDLSNNKIQEVRDETFTSLTKLKSLNLQNNLFHKVNIFIKMEYLQLLDLSFNFVSEVPETFLKSIKTSGLDLTGNPYSCTCAIQPFKKWILSDTCVFLEPNLMYRCAGPSKMDGLSITQIDIDCKSKVPIYIGTSACVGFLLCLNIVSLFRLRWHIRYKLFLLFKRRRYRKREHEEDGIELNRLGYDAFVSYAHESNRDLNWVLDELRVNMEEGPDPITLCIGQSRDYIPGANLIEAITDAIHNSRKAIIVLSPNYVASEWCYFEVQQAWLRLLNEGQDVIVMVLLDPIPDNKMTMWLRQFLCKKGYLKWPGDRAGQNLFWQYLREKFKLPTAVDRRYDA